MVMYHKLEEAAQNCILSAKVTEVQKQDKGWFSATRLFF
jgi:hypothetical protein